MAIVKTISPKIKTQVHLSEALAYITKDEKVSDCYYHNSVNDTDIEAVAEEFQSTRIMLRQDKGIIASHICQSFSPEDKITPEIAIIRLCWLRTKTVSIYTIILLSTPSI